MRKHVKKITHKDLIDNLCLILSSLIVLFFMKDDNENPFIIKLILFCLMTIFLYIILVVSIESLDQICLIRREEVNQEELQKHISNQQEDIKRENRIRISEFLDYNSNSPKELWGTPNTEPRGLDDYDF